MTLNNAQNICGEDININFGHSSRLPYDDSTYFDKVQESVAPLQYRMDTNNIYNCDACLSTLGPRSGFMGFGVSMPVENEPAVSQRPEVVDIESVLTNRNVYASKDRMNEVNSIDVTKLKLKNPKICNSFLNPISSRLSNPVANYRDMGVNRFYDLNKNPQANIFNDFAVNTTLEAKDNFIQEVPKIWSVVTSQPCEAMGVPRCKTIRVGPIMPMTSSIGSGMPCHIPRNGLTSYEGKVGLFQR